VPHQQVKLLELPLPDRSLLSELTLDEAKDLMDLGTAWATLCTIIPCSSHGSESTGNDMPLSPLGSSFVGGALARPSFHFCWNYAGDFLLKSYDMLRSLLELKLRFVDSYDNFWLLDAGVKPSCWQLQFDGSISPGHQNGTQLDLYHSFLIGGNHTLVNNSQMEDMPGNNSYLLRRIGEYWSSTPPGYDIITFSGYYALVILLSLILILILASLKYSFILHDQRLRDDTLDCKSLPVCDDDPDDSYSFLFGLDDDDDIDAGNASDDDADADPDELAYKAAENDSLCYSLDSNVGSDDSFSLVSATDDENSIFSMDSSADVEVDNDLAAPVIETLCYAVDVHMPIVEVCCSAPQLRRSPRIAKMEHICYKKFF
jgi:hypothetical protein